MDAQTPHPKNVVSVDEIVKVPKEPVSRRALLKLGMLGATATTLASIDAVAWAPKRVEAATTATTFSDIQFDIGKFISPAQTIAGVSVQFGPVFTYMLPAALTRTPSKADQTVLDTALKTIESHYAFSPAGIFTLVSYGVPYFNRLPQALVSSHMPTLITDNTRSALEEAVPGPTDVSPLNPGTSKQTFNVPVQIESNDLLFTLRSDSMTNITDVATWLNGSNTLKGKSVTSPAFKGLLKFGTPRVNFVQPGMPRQLANQHKLPYANEINPASSMWSGFVDQQTGGSAPSAATVTFVGTKSAHLTSAKAGDYFDNATIQHVSHVINDLAQFYSKDPANPETFSERVQYMFRSKTNKGTTGLPFPMDPKDPFTNGGGLGAPTGNLATQQKSAFLLNNFRGTDDIATNFDPAVTDHKKYRVGHEQGLQRSSRAADGTPLHIRNDGPGLSTLDIPGGALQPTLEFSIFVPTADFFRVMRINSASLDYVKFGQGGGTGSSVAGNEEAADFNDAGLERFTTATRRQNFLMPPRRHRSFPLLELT